MFQYLACNYSIRRLAVSFAAALSLCAGVRGAETYLNLPPKCGEPGKKCGCPGQEVENACIKVTVDLGETTPWTGSMPCALKIFADNDSPLIFTVDSLYAVLGGYTFKRLGALNLADGETPAEVVLSRGNGEPVHFVFKDGESMAQPDPGVHIKMDERLMMVDAEGWATTGDPVYYDLYVGDGSRRRFLATNRTGALGSLVSLTDARGVTVTPADMGVDIVYDANGVRQFRTPSRLADITSTADFSGYDVTVYALQDAPAKDAQTGLYPLPATQPMEAISIRRERNGRRAVVTVRKGGGDIKRYIFDYAMGDWSLTRPSGLEERKERYIADERDARIIENAVSASGVRLSRTESNYKWESWGFAMTNRVEGFGGVTDTTTWTYYTSGNGKGQVKTEQHQSGLLIQYAYDNLDRMTSETRSGPDMMTEVTTYDYSPVDPSDPVLSVDTRPRTIVRKLNNIECERTYYVYSPLTNIVERVGTQGASYGGTNVLRTVTAFYPVAANDARSGFVASIRHEDGKLDLYDYELSSNIWVRTVTHLHEQSTTPVSGKTTRDVTITSARGEEIEARTEAYIDGMWYTISRNSMTYNAEGKRTSLENLAGQVTTTAWDCCHKVSETQPDGSTTTWDYDDEGRVIASSRLIPLDMANVTWLTTCYEYDDLGRQTATWQTNLAAHVGLPVTRTTYDQLGRVIARVDQLGNTTTTEYSPDGRTVFVRNPNTSTRVVTRSPNGDTLSITGTAVTPEFHSYGVLPDGTRWSKTVQGETASSPRFTKRYENLLGQTVREERSGFKGAVLATTRNYDSLGRLVTAAVDGEPTKDFNYDNFGNLETQVLTAGAEWRRYRSASVFVKHGAEILFVQTNETFCSEASIETLSKVETVRLTGLTAECPSRSVDYDVYGHPTETWEEFSDGFVTMKRRSPGSTNISITVSRYDEPLVAVSTSAVTNAIVYDALGRAAVQIDGRGSRLITEYDAYGRRLALVDAAGSRTEYTYDAFGRIAATMNAMGGVVAYEYDMRGHKIYEGGATYPVRYTYDIFGNKISMVAYRDEMASGGDETRWHYDEASNCMTNKIYADGKGTSYDYDSSGRLSKRIWARGIETTYSYNAWGDLVRTDYSDDTPSVVLAYDAMGRQVRAIDAAGVTTFAYDIFGALTNETVVGVAGANTIERFYDAFGRDVGYALNGVRQSTLSYDSATGRIVSMLAVGSETPFAWNYLSGSDLKSSLSYPNGSTVSWTYDAKNQLLQVCNAFPTNTISQYDYTYDAAGHRVSCGKSGSAFTQDDSVAYGYNEKSELTNAVAAVNSDYRYSYDFDDIGNRESSSERGTNSVYTANNLNQYTAVDDFTPQYDDDGNQTLVKTATGIWSVPYNGENRPIYWSRIQSNNSNNTNNQTILSMSYDRMGRRVTKNDQRFVYNGYLQIANFELVSTNSQLTTLNSQLFIWDPTETVATRPIVWYHGNSAEYYTHDGIKNVSEVIAVDGSILAHYGYAPFGNVCVQEGGLAGANPFRFSCEFADGTLGLVYYNHRHYEPVMGRWLQRDKIGENGGVGLYVFCNNCAQRHIDKKGLRCSITLYAGHATTVQRLLSDLAKNNKGPSECGDLIGIVSCFRDQMNAEAERKFPGHVIPGIPKDPGNLHKDEVKYNPNNDELASSGLLRAWEAALKAAQGLQDTCCCLEVSLSVKCDRDMKNTTRWIEVQSIFNNPAYQDHKGFNWCTRKGTYSTLWKTFNEE